VSEVKQFWSAAYSDPQESFHVVILGNRNPQDPIAAAVLLAMECQVREVREGSGSFSQVPVLEQHC
jgi:hypothetical protein